MRIEQSPGVWHMVALVPLGATVHAEAECPVGTTIEDAAQTLLAGRPIHRYQCLIGGVPLGRDQWKYCHPKRGARVRMVPRLELTAALIALLPVLGTAIGGTTIAGVIVAVASVGLTFGVSFLARQLFGPPKVNAPSFGGTPLTEGFQGVRNEARPYQPVSVVFGEMRVFPPPAAQPYTETEGGNTIARMLFTPGVGPLEIDDLRIGEVPFESFDGAEAYIRNGEPSDPDELQLFRNQVTEAAGGFQFRTFKAKDPAPLVSPWAQNVTADATEEIELRLAFPNGCFRLNNKGDIREFGMNVELAYKLTTDTNWVPWQESDPFPDPPKTIIGLFNLGKIIPDLDGNVSYFGDFGSDPDRYSQYGIRARDQDGFFVTFRARVARGQYDVRMRRVEVWARESLPQHKQTASVAGDFIWDKIISLNTDAVLSDAVMTGADRICTVEVRIPIRDQIGGFLESFNCRARAKLPVYDPADPSADPTTGWTSDSFLTANPASAFLSVFRKYMLNGLADSKFDWDRLTEWYLLCEAEGYVCHDERSEQAVSPEWAAEIASTGRAGFDDFDSLISVATDEPKDSPEQMITPANANGLNFNQTYTDPPHAVRVRHIDSDNGYDRQGETVVYWQGFDVSTATRYEELQRYGACSRELAYADGLYFMAVDRLRRRVGSVGMDIEQLWLRRGSLVCLNYDTMLIGQSWGRISSIALDGGNNQVSFVLDQFATFIFGETYAVDIRHVAGSTGLTFWDDGSSWSDGSSWIDPGAGSYEKISADVVNPASVRVSTQTITFVTPLAPGAVAVGDLVAFGIRNKQTAEFVVRAIRPGNDMSGQLELIDYAPAIFDVDDPGNIPPFDPGSSSPVPPVARGPLKPVVSAIADERALLQSADGSLVPRIILIVTTPDELTPEQARLPKAKTYDVQVRQSSRDVPGSLGQGQDDADNQPGTSWRSSPPYSAGLTRLPISEVLQGSYYDVRLRSVSGSGIPSEWVLLSEVFVTGKLSPPPDVSAFVRQGDFLTWTLPERPLDLQGFTLRYRRDTLGDWDTAFQWNDPASLIASSPYFFGVSPPSAQQYLIKAVDTSGNESVNPATLNIPVTEIVPFNLFDFYPFESTEGPVDWPGIVTNGQIDGGDGALEAVPSPGSGDLAPFWSNDAQPFWTNADGNPFWGQAFYETMVYEASIIVPQSRLPSASVGLTVTMDQGPQPMIEYRSGHREKPVTDMAHQTAVLGTLGTPGAIQDPDGRDAIVLTAPVDVSSPIEALATMRASVTRKFWGVSRGFVFWVKVPGSVFATGRWTATEGLSVRFSEGTAATHQRVYYFGLNDLLSNGWARIVVHFDHTAAASSAGNGALASFDPDTIEISTNAMQSYTAGVNEGVSQIPVDIGPGFIWTVHHPEGIAPRVDAIWELEDQDDIDALVGAGVTESLETAIVHAGNASGRFTSQGTPTPKVVSFPTIFAYDVTESILCVPVYVESAHYGTLDVDNGIVIRVTSNDGGGDQTSTYPFGTIDILPDEWTLLKIDVGVDATDAETGGGADPLFLTVVDVGFNFGSAPTNDASVIVDEITREYYRNSGFSPWPNILYQADNELYEWRLTFLGAPEVQDRMLTLEANIDVIDIEEIIDQTITAGDARLVLTKQYRVIKEVFLEVTGTTADSARVVDYDAHLGPRIQTTASGVVTADSVRARVRGY